MKRLLITDLDNTLYDWVTFYAQSFSRMVDELVLMLGVPRERLLDDFKLIHQQYGNSEQPFATLELEAVQKRFGGATRNELVEHLAPAFDAFNKTRHETLHLYPGVAETLQSLHAQGVKVVAHTEALAANAWYRLRTLNVAPLVSRLYALEGALLPHPRPEREPEHALPTELVRVVPRSERKPNPRLLLDICTREGVDVSEAVYVGDSLTRDIWMAKQAGMTAVWARYGLAYDPTLWEVLVRITHWTPEDVVREAQLKRDSGRVEPDFTIDEFRDLVPIVFA